jgi:hypothetical protein
MFKRVYEGIMDGRIQMTALDYIHHNIEVKFKFLSGSVVFCVGTDSLTRFHHCYRNNINEFFVCPTLKDTCIAINLEQVETASFSWAKGVVDTERNNNKGVLTIYTMNENPIIYKVIDPADLVNALAIMELGEFVPIDVISLDQGDEKMFIGSDEIMYLEIPTDIVLEGERRLLEEDLETDSLG